MTTGYWSIIVPEATTNLVQNPNANVTGGLTAIGAGTVSRVTTYSYLGSGCHRIVASADNTGGYLTLTACANAIHYVTLRLNTASDLDAFDISLDNSNWNDMALVGQEGSWYVYGVQIPAAQANGSTALRIQQKGAGAIDLFIGHAQVEQKEYATTPVTGSITGFLSDGYAWSGSPNASSSTRSAQERSGGRVYNLDTYGVTVLSMQGTGMPPLLLRDQSQALLPGRRYSGQKVGVREFILTADVEGATWAGYHAYREDLIDILKADLVHPDQPVILRYTGAGTTTQFICRYAGGLEGGMHSGFSETFPLRFVAHDPYAYEIGEASAILTVAESVADADYAIKRVSGDWSNVTTALNGNVLAFAKAANGNIYIGGVWAADISTAADGYGIGIIEYNPTSGVFTSIGTGLGGNKDVYGMAVAPNGDLYIIGDFLDAGGVANADYCAFYDISAGNWTAMLTGCTAGASGDIAIGQNGYVYLSAGFIDVGDADGDYIVAWSGSAWVSLSSGLDEPASKMAIAPNGDVWVGGDFGYDGTLTIQMDAIGFWDGTAWNAVGAGLAHSTLTRFCSAIAFDKAGRAYVGGLFETADGVTCANIAVWNGKTFEPLGSGVNDIVREILVANDGLVYVFGDFTTAGDLTVDRAAVWNGYTWARLPIDLPGSPVVYDALTDGNNLYLGYTTAGAASTSAISTVTNGGTARAYPVLHIKREGGTSATVEWLKNETTGATIYLNYALLDGEELTLDFRLGRRAVTSSYFGPVWRAVLRGSDFNGFYLQPGANSISFFLSSAGSPTLTRYFTWTTTHLGVDGGAA